MGTHPDFPEVSFFNGLGSKGVLNGPWHASQLVAHLLDGEEIPSHCDLRSLLRNSS
jgi:glycine/D-amino acid oxidase-like deaminating enzyme